VAEDTRARAARRDRLARRRKALGLTQEDLAGMLSVERTTVVRWERGETEPQPWLRPKLATALKVPVDRLEELLTLRGAARSGVAVAQVPRQLPAAVPGFTGRAAELATLTRMLDEAAGGPGTVVISAIGGTAGVGKTALAVHWAHGAAGRFPDGQLYVNLRGYDPGQPVPAIDALAGFLRALGVPGQDIPAEADERAARYRSMLAGRRMLVVLDNAGSADQVRPLLPASPACIVLVTSRDTLSGLAALDGAARLELDVLPEQDAVALLRTLIGARVDAEPETAAKLASQCCRLPLALRVAAELAASRPAVPLAGLTAELADMGARLDLLGADGDSRTQVRAVFSWSCRHLDAEAARAFRLLGLHPGPDLDPYAVAALIGTTVPQGHRALDALARAHLIQPAGADRHAMHDLLSGYARELSATVDGGEEQRAALTRLFDHYLYAAAAAMDIVFYVDPYRRPRISRPTTPIPPLADLAAARDWLDGERAALVAVTAHAAAHGWPGHATRLAATLASYLHRGCHYPEALTIFTHAVDAARRTGDCAAEATAMNEIGSVALEQGRLQQAADHYRQALALFREAGDRAGEARPLGNLGLVEKGLARYEQSASHLEQAVAIFRDIGDRFSEARALGNLGSVRALQGRYEEAVSCHQQALDLHRQIGDHGGEAHELVMLGDVDLMLGSYQHAAGHFQRALVMLQGISFTSTEPYILTRLGEAYVALGRYEQAAGNFEQAIAAFRETGDWLQEAQALNGFGDLLCRTGDAGKARAYHAAALRLATEACAPREQARAHRGLARACHASGKPVQARRHRREALAIYTAIRAPEADQVRAEMATVDHDQQARS